MEGYERKELKWVENSQNWQISMKQAKSWQTIQPDRSPVSDQRCDASFWKTEPDFPFSTLQTLDNWAKRIMTPLVI